MHRHLFHSKNICPLLFLTLPSDELDKKSQRTWLIKNFSQWNGYSHFRSGLNWLRKFKKRCFKNQMSVIWSWTYFYNLHWNNYLYFKGLLNIWEKMIMWHCYSWPVSFHWLKFLISHVRWLFLSNSSEGGPVGIFKCGSRKEKYLRIVTI
jgi:hypothetical protein